MKNCIHSAVAMQSPWKPAVTLFLQNFCATLHATMYWFQSFWTAPRSEMCTKLNVLNVSPETKSHAQVKDTGTQKQLKSKVYINKRRGAKCLISRRKIKWNDKVSVKKSIQVNKGTPQYTRPLSVKKRLGPSTYLLTGERSGSLRTWPTSQERHKCYTEWD